jgi:nitrite reductase/ring-hydroxylating ferredoxin subunit
MGRFIKVASVGDVPAGKGIGVEAGGERIALFRLDDTYYAIGDTCPHRGGPLSDGMIDGTTVTCPWHGAEFDICTGKNLCPPAARPVAAFPVRVEGDEIQIELP